MEKELTQKVDIKDIPRSGLFIYRKEIWLPKGKHSSIGDYQRYLDIDVCKLIKCTPNERKDKKSVQFKRVK